MVKKRETTKIKFQKKIAEEYTKVRKTKRTPLAIVHKGLEFCPSCRKRDFIIVDYDVAPPEEDGMFMFLVRCSCSEVFSFTKNI